VQLTCSYEYSARFVACRLFDLIGEKSFISHVIFHIVSKVSYKIMEDAFWLVNCGSELDCEGCYFRTRKLFMSSCFSSFTTLYTCDVSHHVTWIGRFSKWPSMEHRKKFVENLVLDKMSFICSFRILYLKKNVLVQQKKGKNLTSVTL